MLVILLVGLGGFALWQFGPSMGINIGKIFSGTSSSSSSSVAKPVITSGSIKSTVDHKSAQIVWTTDQPSSSQVEYGTTTSYGSVAPAAPSTDPTGGQSLGVVTHQVDLTGLNASTTYHYKVKSKNKAGEVVSSDQQFTTNATPVVE